MMQFNNNFGMNYGYQGGGLGVNLNNNTNDINNNKNMGGNNMNYQNQNNAVQDNYEPIILDVDQQEFDGVLKTKLTTTTDLAKMVNKLFKPVFVDYEGCLILPNQMGGFDTTIYFRDKGVQDENKLSALQHVVQAQGGNLSMSQRLQNINLRYKNKTYDLTRECKDVFKEFMITDKGSSKVNWSKYVVEKTEPSYNGYSIYVQLNGVDIMKIIKKIYGASIEGKRTDYNMRLERGLGVVNGQGLFANYLVSIMQLDTREVEKIAQSVGMVPLAGNIPMVR